MATLHSNRTTSLPDDRVKVYDEVVELLLECWHKPEDGERSPLEVLLITLSQLRGRMEGLAFEVHSDHVDRTGTADIAEAALSAAFRPLLGGSHDKAQQVIQYIEQRTGLWWVRVRASINASSPFPPRLSRIPGGLPSGRAARFREAGAHALVLLLRRNTGARVVVYAARIAGTDRGVGVADALIHRQTCDDYRCTHARPTMTGGRLYWPACS